MEKIGKKLKHDHTLTSILKFAIFSMVMLAPIFSVATRCLYVICNKNAKDSYSNQKIEYNYQIENISQYANGLEYTLVSKNNPPSANGNYHPLSYISLTADDLGIQQNVYLTISKWIFLNNGQIVFCDDNNSWLTRINFGVANPTFSQFNFIGEVGNEIFSYGVYYTTFTTQALDNAFEYSLNQLEESSYYNWATNLGIYTPINNMVNGLGGHSIISLLLAYWSIYTAIYIVFDIIITCFVKITHLIQGE